MSRTSTKVQALLLSCALVLPAESAFAKTKKRHHYSRERGTAIGAVVGAAVSHKKPLKGALIGAAVGNIVQDIRNKKQK